MTLKCVIQDQPGVGNTLRCTLTCDQTYVRPMLAQLGQALQQFPVIGEGRD
jgi:hypothetical protein